MENLVHLLLTRRGAALAGAHPVPAGPSAGSAYRAEDYPTPEAVARRCAEGLVTVKPENKPHEGEEGHLHGDIRPVHDSPLRFRWECWGWLEATYQA